MSSKDRYERAQGLTSMADRAFLGLTQACHAAAINRRKEDGIIAKTMFPRRMLEDSAFADTLRCYRSIIGRDDYKATLKTGTTI
jgi:hypothetical protein|tara:strand:+ start:774 stop:1025 length:252 start_codon:yes stop_codon:yes gene_type:complete